MKTSLPLPQEMKLTVLCRIESGCLGPDGLEHIEEFCRFAQKEFNLVDSDFVQYVVIPRHDKSLPEIQYKIHNKNLTPDKLAKYLGIFNTNTDEFEGQLHEKLIYLIDQYLGR